MKSSAPPSPITTHVLDTAKGCPARNVGVTLSRRGPRVEDWQELSRGQTNDDGRVTDLLTRDEFAAGVYKISFDIGPYHGGNGFFPTVDITFEVKNANQHHHVPLLISPFGYSTYRGS